VQEDDATHYISENRPSPNAGLHIREADLGGIDAHSEPCAPSSLDRRRRCDGAHGNAESSGKKIPLRTRDWESFAADWKSTGQAIE
jgi:hypothetical protein